MKKTYFIDLDGTMYRGSQIIEGAKEFIDTLTKRGERFVFLTNNAKRTKRQNVEHMEQMLSLIHIFNSLKERSHSIYQYVDDYVDKTTFQNTEALTRDNPAYIRMKEKLEEVKASTNVRYLYTAEKNIQGEYVYLVDGLPYDSSDFRNPGDKIEEEIIPELTAALHDKIILPNQIKNTEWGPIFISYFPIHKGNEVVGVLGIEFDATHQYRAFPVSYTHLDVYKRQLFLLSNQ